MTGASNLVFLFLVLSGFYLWWPRQCAGRRLVSGWIERPRARFQLAQRDRTVERAGAVHCRAGRSGDLVPVGQQPGLRIDRQPGPSHQRRQKGGGAGKKGGPRAPRPQGGEGNRPDGGRDLEAVDRLWPVAEQRVPGWRSISLVVPVSERASLVFTIDRGDGGQPQKRSTLSVDQRTGEAREWTTFADGSSGQRLRSWLRFTHTGEYYGIIGQTVAGVASAGGAVLVWTGIAMALARFSAWRARGRRLVVPAAEPVVARQNRAE